MEKDRLKQKLIGTSCRVFFFSFFFLQFLEQKTENEAGGRIDWLGEERVFESEKLFSRQ